MPEPPFRLDWQRALVTGGDLAFVAALAAAAAAVSFVARDAARNWSAVADLGRAGVEALAIDADLAAEGGPEYAVMTAVEHLGGLDLLVNNVGTGFHHDSRTVTDAEWDAVFDLNLKAMFRTCVAARPHLRDGGSIVNIGSMSGLIVNRPQWQAPYDASKAAVDHLTRSLAAEWAPDGIRVNALAPGYVKTELAPVDRADLRRYWIEEAPLQRYASPGEIPPSVVFLASPAASFITGSVLVADGGYTLW